MTECTDQLPPVGSLWLHRVSGVQRLVMSLSPPDIDPEPIEFVGVDRILRTCTIADWLAWQDNAERIDREEA